jgi:SPP1 gp7 family putative phage head morphogenesis protein
MNNYPLLLEKQLVDSYLKLYKGFSRSLLKRPDNPTEINREKIKTVLLKGFEMLDSWSAMQLEKFILQIRKEYFKQLKTNGLANIFSRRYFKNPENLERIEKRIEKRYRLDAIEVTSIQGFTKQQIEDTVETNVKLIKSLELDTRLKVQKILQDGLLLGKAQGTIQKELETVAKISERRARFWAEDQTSKFFGEVTRQRQVASGFPGFIWISMKDSKVRPSHLEFEGKYFDWEKGTGQRNREFPGRDYRCRCIARPAFKEQAPNETQYKRQAEQDRWNNANRTQKLQIEFDKFYDELLQEVNDGFGEDFKTNMGNITKEFVEKFNATEATKIDITWNTVNIKKEDLVTKSVQYSGKVEGFQPGDNQISIFSEFGIVDNQTIANFKMFSIPTEMQGKGFAKKVFKEFLDNMKKIEVSKINIYANKDIGGYAWAKFGFYADNKKVVDDLLEFAKNKLKVSDDILNMASDIVNNFYTNNHPDKPFPMEHLGNMNGSETLLKNNRWDGHLDLKNKEHLKKIYNYIKGKK